MKEVTLVAMFELPLRVNAETNARQHWAKRAQITKRERFYAQTGTYINVPEDIKRDIQNGLFDVGVVFVRYGKRLLDDDNLATAFKHVRDGVADTLGVDDGSARYTWEYMQVKGKEYKVRIEIGVKNHVQDTRMQQAGTQQADVPQTLRAGVAKRTPRHKARSAGGAED